MSRPTNPTIDPAEAPPASEDSGSRLPVSRFLSWSWRVFAVTWVAYAGYYFVRQAFSVAKLGILEDPGVNKVLTEQALGVIDGIYLALYAVGQFLWGAYADRFGPRIVVIGGMTAAIAASLALGVGSSLLVFALAMGIQGLAQATGWAPLCKNMVSFFPVPERGRVMGLWCSSYAFGGLAAPPFLGWWAYSVFDSWHAAFIAGAAAMSFTLVLFVVFQRNAPADVGLPAIDDDTAKFPRNDGRAARDTFALYRKALRDRMVMTLAVAYFLLKPARYALLLWGPVIVSRRLPEVGMAGATFIPVSVAVAGVIAPMVIGWLSDKVFDSRRIPPLVLSLGLLVVVLVLFMPLTATGSVWVMIAVLAVIGLALYAADAMIVGVAAVDFGNAAGAGTSTGVINGFGSVGAILGGLLPGFLSTTPLFYTFAAAACIAGLVLLPHWNRRPQVVAP
ncbi:MFS transporter [Streptomyces sp. NBC_00090]|uniref:MFS transporter n=1 Tax=Streptomyces sp. NBC_00090 TaxID=2903619 RepID=UPI003243067F